MKSKVLRCVLIAALTMGILTACEDDNTSNLPNIILLMGDDHGWEETGYNGHPHVQTPVLDDMAANGLRLDRFYAAHPSCSPTRGSILTGRHPNRYGVFTPNFSIRPEEVTFGHLLEEADYLRGHFGKWHVGPVKADSPTSPGAMGFDEWLSHDNFFELDPPLSEKGGPSHVYRGESSTVLVERTMQFIETAKAQGRPFLAVVWFGSPHEPYSGLPEDLALYDDLPGRYASRDSVRLTSNETGQQVMRPLGDVLRERYAEITAMDRSIGRLRNFLREEGLRENTLVWYTSDNGTPPSGVLTSPLRGMKSQVYEGGIRVPTVIEWPARVATPRVSAVNAVTSDIFPTIISLAGVDASEDRPIDGINLVPMLDGALAERPSPIFFWQYDTGNLADMELEPWIDAARQEGTTPLVKLMNGIATRNFKNYRHPQITDADYRGARAMLDNHFKLIVHDMPGNTEPNIELFDMRADPAESINLVEQNPQVVEEMNRQLHAWQASVLESLSGKDYRN